ncbi:hypothetical protein [Deinococcus ruber]|uniref:Outer membrane protein beta-barrel domain-containing protein n=1 Tax=Deinococcus ruber TaxID=1848197 RepID=A0A918F3N8_9DEIO|nr:hypothetical protein [Deinococcus ruber]GGR01658.1 hypothetical protein GCM10008957_13070 [Deinococcus ruber]
MKKILFGMTTLALASATPALAANYIGGSIGSGLTVHYQSDLGAGSAIRYGLNLSFFGLSSSGLTLGGGVDYLTPISGQNFGGLSPYYGFGLDAGVYLGGGSAVSIYPHVLAGLKYNVSAPLSVFAELNAGPSITVGSGTGIGFGYGGRIGLNYQLP